MISRGSGQQGLRCAENKGRGEETQEDSAEWQRGDQYGELPGKQRCQVWAVVGPAGPLRHQEDTSRWGGVTWQREAGPGDVGFVTAVGKQERQL